MIPRADQNMAVTPDELTHRDGEPGEHAEILPVPEVEHDGFDAETRPHEEPAEPEVEDP
jgi:hypothetical protein